jgi:hypothetical protein
MTARSGVEPHDGSGETTNSNAARAGNTGGGWHPNNRLLVKAEAPALSPLNVAQDDRIQSEIQAPNWGRTNFRQYATGCFRSQQGSGMDPFNNLIDRHAAMKRMIWSAEIRPIEKLIVVFALQYSDPAEYPVPEGILPFAHVRLAELSDFIGASIPKTRDALSSLEKIGILQVTEIIVDGIKGLNLSPDLDAIGDAFLKREG